MSTSTLIREVRWALRVWELSGRDADRERLVAALAELAFTRRLK